MNQGGGTYRSKGTPSFGKLAYRATGSQPTDPVFAHIQPNLGKVSSKDLKMLLDLGISEKNTQNKGALDLIRIADQEGILPKYNKSGAVLAGGAGLPLDYSLNNLLNVANDLTADDFNPDGTLKEGKKAVTGRELKESLKRQLIQNSNATKQTMSTLGVKRKDKQKFKNGLMYQMSLIDDNALYSDKGNRNLGIRSFFDDGQYMIEEGLKESGLSKRETKKRIQKAKTAIREIRFNFAQPLYNLLKSEGAIVEEPGSDGSVKRYRVKGESTVREVNTHTPRATTKGMRMPKSKVSETSVQTPRRRKTDTSVQKPIKKQIKRGTSKFGAAAGLAVVGTAAFGVAAQAFGRASGTPSYGEQGITPAMLTPGEFVVNSQSAQQFGPQLQAMNQGGIVYRQDPSGTGYDPVTPEAQKYIDAYNEKINEIQKNKPGAEITIEDRKQASKYAESVSPRGRNRKPGRFAKAIDSAKGGVSKVSSRVSESGLSKNIKALNETVKKNVKTINKNTNVVEDVNKGSKDQNAKNKFAGRLGGVSTVGFAVSGAAMAYGMMGQGKNAEMASNVGQVGMAVASLAMFLPLLSNKFVMVLAPIVGVIAAIKLYQKVMSDATKEGLRTAKSLGLAADEIEKVSEATGNISRSQLAERQREGRVRNFNPIQSDFGTGYMETDAGKDLIKFATEFEKQGINSARVIANKLSLYVADGLMDAAQAESVAAELGRSLGDRTFGIKVLGTLQDIIGINGKSLTTNPIEIRVNLLENTERSSQEYIDNLEKELKVLETGQVEDSLLERILKKLPGYQIVGRQEVEAKISAATTGNLIQQLELSQQLIDSSQIEYDTKIKQVKEEEELVKKQLAVTTNLKERLKLEQLL
jgi:hypothetical protein